MENIQSPLDKLKGGSGWFRFLGCQINKLAEHVKWATQKTKLKSIENEQLAHLIFAFGKPHHFVY